MQAPWPGRGIGKAGLDVHGGVSHAEGGPEGGRDPWHVVSPSAHVHQLVHRGVVCKRLEVG